MSVPEPTAGAAVKPTRMNGGYAWAVLVMLTAAYTVSFIDRQVLNLLIDPIKMDLGATDTQMSLLQGLAFIIAYIAFIPIFGRLADTRNRRNLVVFGVVTWSAFTILCGFSTNLETLFFGRAGVGAAEAALGPAAWSIISDYFTKEKLPRAMSVFLMGPYLGGGLALIFGGLVIGSATVLSQTVPALSNFSAWQLTFIFVGAPGIVLGLAMLIMREPPRQATAGAALDDRQFSLGEAAAFIWQRRAFYLRFFAAMALVTVVLYALPAWMPSVLIRNYGADAGNVGLVFGALVLLMGSLGVLSGPVVGALIRKRGHKSSVIICVVIAALALVPITAMIPFAPSYAAIMAVAALATFFYSFPQAMSASALQVATPNRMRGVVTSIYTFILSGFGLGVAPTLVALLTDFVFRDPAHVNQSLAIVCAVSAALAAWLGWGALPHFRKALEAEEAETARLAAQQAST